jgi:hypothetical protein
MRLLFAIANSIFPFTLAVALVAVTASTTGIAAPGDHGNPQADVLTNPEVSPADHHDTLPTLRGILPKPDDLAHANHAIPVRPTPALDAPGSPADGAVQGSSGAQVSTVAGSGVDGVGQGFTGPNGTFTVNSAPPDTVGAVGALQYVQVVNTGFAVFDKATKAVQYGPVSTNTLWTGFGGPCEADNDGDAVVVYDKAANRWVVSQFAVTATPYYQCVAVSAGQDATGAWYRYAFDYGSVFPDYPKIGVWPDAYYITFNMFNGNSFTGAKLCAYDRSAMLSGLPATQQCFQLSSAYASLLPADLDGWVAPPAGSPEFVVNRGSSNLNLWRFHVDFANAANTKLTGPFSMPVAAFTSACNGGACIPQAGTSEVLDSLGDRLMYRLAYRNFTTYESLVVTHSVSVQAGPGKKNVYTGVRWYELRNPNATPTVYQQSTFAPDSNFRWMGSIAQDKQGNMALGYSVSSANMHPAIRYTGRLVTDALNTMEAEASIIEGTGSQIKNFYNLTRWGDYSSMTIDPADDCTFWYTTEYLKTNGTFNWSTRIASFKFPGCV